MQRSQDTIKNNLCKPIDTFIDPKIGMAQAPLQTTHLLSLDNKSLMPRRKSEKLCSKTNTSGLPILVCLAVLLLKLTTKRNLRRNAAYTYNKRRHINFCMLDGYPSHYFLCHVFLKSFHVIFILTQV